MPTGIQRRRTQHRRQLSTPAAFDAQPVRPQPANSPQRRHNRSGMSLDLRGMTLSTTHAAQHGHYPDYTTPGPIDTRSFQQEDSTTSLPSPRTPHQSLRAQSPQQPPHSPSKAPTEQQLKELPGAFASHEPLTAITQPPNFTDMGDLNFEPTSSAMTFDFENPEADMGYESSSYYTSDALSPSPISSPTRETRNTFLEGIEEHKEMSFSQPPTLLPSPQSSMALTGLPLDMESYEQSPMFNDLDVDASLEYTGIAPEEVQRYISEQDPVTSKWTCLYLDCGKVFGRRENIRSHVQTHLGDRQFKCNGCGKCFVRQHDLKRHAKIHSGNKPYKCPCGAGFARQDALTRHRQRGMCVGGFADAVRRQAKRGRPKKNRPDMEDRVDKATRTRRALASAAPSSAGSPYSEVRSPSPLDGYKAAQSHNLPQMMADAQSYNESMNASNDPFSFDTSSSRCVEDTEIAQSNFMTTSSYVSDVASMNILQQLSQSSHTPPMSPAELRPHSSGSTKEANAPAESSPLKGSSSPSRSSIQSNQFTTPPTSPMEPKDDLNELFDILPDNSYSQFDLEMKAMGDFTSLDNSSYDLLDFTV
ncbi:similar to BTE binding protein 4 [Plenodomus lingam JN3]|uniref:Similar to BTE binding protein 4 n=1 Tax=Leptosphaeria maculans (strain JN3 / isolate v23.1.3 / race Av1-4-5-6-7-8) TaxID=985895 RepID=E4ZWE5_LEPMJ|nr:similar to BTE binding protein 4 [Plenodomus lingam JN3]CBX95921.1 similar to BTE binding protein 4 [Plenodomus lingam JN3]